MSDQFPGQMSLHITGPANDAIEVTPDNDNDLPDGVCRGLWVGAAGDVEVITREGTTPVVIAAVAAGTLLPIRVRRVLDDNTDADEILALY